MVLVCTGGNGNKPPTRLQSNVFSWDIFGVGELITVEKFILPG
jgi:hypothetical protein